MFQMDLKARFHNKAFLMALVSAILLLLKNLGLGQYIPENIDSIVNGFITIGILLGVITDTSTPGISDQVVSDATVKAINNQEQVKAEASTISINNTISENSQSVTFDKTGMTTTGGLKITSQDGTSQLIVNDNTASSKIVVDNPENVIEDGKEVNPVTATSPTV